MISTTFKHLLIIKALVNAHPPSACKYPQFLATETKKKLTFANIPTLTHMSEYIVSARKYRPTTFDSVVGQHALTTTLKNAIAQGKLAHAYLFVMEKLLKLGATLILVVLLLQQNLQLQKMVCYI